MIRNTTKLQKLCWLLLICYLIGLVYFTFFAEALGRRIAPNEAVARFNLVPFREIRRFWRYREQLGLSAFLLNVFGNAAVFVPCGFLLPAVSRRCRNWLGVCLVVFCISFLIECTQLAFRVGSFDIDDLMLNTLGGMLGFGLNRLIQMRRLKRKREAARRKVRIRKLEL